MLSVHTDSIWLLNINKITIHNHHHIKIWFFSGKVTFGRVNPWHTDSSNNRARTLASKEKYVCSCFGSFDTPCLFLEIDYQRKQLRRIGIRQKGKAEWIPSGVSWWARASSQGPLLRSHLCLVNNKGLVRGIITRPSRLESLRSVAAGLPANSACHRQTSSSGKRIPASTSLYTRRQRYKNKRSGVQVPFWYPELVSDHVPCCAYIRVCARTQKCTHT